MTSITDQRNGDDRRRDFPIEETRIPLKVVASVIAIVAGLLMTYYASVNAANVRISVLENQQQSTQRSLDRIEQRGDRIEQKVDTLMSEVRQKP